MTITEGRGEANESVLQSHGGGVLNDEHSQLTLTEVTVSNNKAVGITNFAPRDELRHFGVGAGGGVANRGKLTVLRSTFDSNQALGADDNTGGQNVFPNLPAINFPEMGIGGGIWNWKTGEVIVTDSHFINNVANGGDRSFGTFAGLGQGGAIYNDNDLTVAGSLFRGNQAIGGNNTNSDVFSGERWAAPSPAGQMSVSCPANNRPPRSP